MNTRYVEEHDVNAIFEWLKIMKVIGYVFPEIKRRRLDSLPMFPQKQPDITHCPSLSPNSGPALKQICSSQGALKKALVMSAALTFILLNDAIANRNRTDSRETTEAYTGTSESGLARLPSATIRALRVRFILTS